MNIRTSVAEMETQLQCGQDSHNKENKHGCNKCDKIKDAKIQLLASLIKINRENNIKSTLLSTMETCLS